MVIGLLGFGTVGGGVYQLLQNHQELAIKYVLCLEKPEGLTATLTSNIEDIVGDPDVDMVIEVMGGLHPAYEFVTAALRAGKHVVTANKLLVATYYKELIDLAREHGAALRCTAAAGGGIPWLYNLERAKRHAKILSVSGIMNGTTNFILDTMHHSEVSFDEVLAQAQSLGYAEANPSADIDGLDIQRKLIISASVAFDTVLTAEQIPVFGIRSITAADISAFRESGYVCKLLATGCRVGDAVAAYVEPALLPPGEPDAAVPANFNQISFEGEHVGILRFFGQGAGRYPTAYNVVQDCTDILGGVRSFYSAPSHVLKVENDAVQQRYYVRTTVRDSFLEKNTDKALPSGAVYTKPVSVAAMHSWAAAARKQDEGLFFASVR